MTVWYIRRKPEACRRRIHSLHRVICIQPDNNITMKLVAIQKLLQGEGEVGLDCKTNYATVQVSRQD